MVQFFGDAARIEAKLVPQAGYAWQAVQTVKLTRPIWSPSNIAALFRLARAVWSAIRQVREFNPDVVLGTGGYTAFPVCLAAALLRVPFYLQEANALPGLVTRALAPLSQAVFTAHPAAAGLLPPRKCVLVGNPIRAQFVQTDRAAAREALGISDGQRLLTVVGGSLGAASLNATVARALPLLLAALPDLVAHHQTGFHSDEPPPLTAAAPGTAPRGKSPLDTAVRAVGAPASSSRSSMESGGASQRRSRGRSHGADDSGEANPPRSHHRAANGADDAAACGLSTHPASAAVAPCDHDPRATASCGQDAPKPTDGLCCRASESAECQGSARAPPRLVRRPFIDDMATQLAASDLVVSRAGAITCSELLATGTPAVLVPLPTAADNHQFHNAASLRAAGAALLLSEDAALTPERLASEVAAALSDASALQGMRTAALANRRDGAAAAIARAMAQTARGRVVGPDAVGAHDDSVAVQPQTQVSV